MPNTLTGLLELALPKPQHIATPDGGAVLALALHCLMVRDGFTVVDESGRKRHSVYCPPSDWNGLYLDQWVFKYTKDGMANRFVLHCSLQAATRRMFIHASEEGNLHNVCVLGLQLDNYVPEPTRLRTSSWEGAVQNQVKLRELFGQYITKPLAEQAEELILAPPMYAADRTYSAYSEPPPAFPYNSHLAALAITGALLAVGTFVVWRGLKTR